MRGTYQPVLMRGVDFYALAIGEHTGPTDQGYIVKMDYVRLAFIEYPPDSPAVHQGPGQLMRCQVGKPRPAALHTIDVDAGRLIGSLWRRPAAQRLVCIKIMDDIDFMTTPGKKSGQLAHIVGIPAKMIWRIKGCYHGKTQSGLPHQFSLESDAAALTIIASKQRIGVSHD